MGSQVACPRQVVAARSSVRTKGRSALGGVYSVSRLARRFRRSVLSQSVYRVGASEGWIVAATTMECPMAVAQEVE